MEQPNTPLPPAGPPTSTTAIISLIAGIAGWTVLPMLGAIVAVITGYLAKSEIRKSAGTLGGNGLATAGLILGYVQLGLGLCACLVWLAVVLLGVSIPFIGNSIPGFH